MLLPSLFALVLGPALASAAIFPSGTLVKSIDAKGFRRAMKENRTSLVAFVAPWCGHCQKMVPEYSKAAKNLHPLVPLYAVDCDDAQNKNLCAEQGVEGFPTVKLFPRGGHKNPVVYPGERTATAFVDYVSRRIPHDVKKLSEVQDILNWIYDDEEVPRALLLTKDKRIPLMWKVLNNRFNNINFGVHRDVQGFQNVMLGVPDGTKIILYGVGSHEPTPYQGSTKFGPLSEYFESIQNGTVVLNGPNQPDDQPQSNDEDPFPAGSQQVTFDEDFGEWHEMRQKRKFLQDAEAEMAAMMRDIPPPSDPTFESITISVSPDPVADPTPSPEPIVNTQIEVPAAVPETETETTASSEAQHVPTEEQPTSNAQAEVLVAVESGVNHADDDVPTIPNAPSEPAHAEGQPTTATGTVETIPSPAPIELLETDPLSEQSPETAPSETISEEDEDCEEVEESFEEEPSSVAVPHTHTEAPRPTDEL